MNQSYDGVTRTDVFVLDRYVGGSSVTVGDLCSDYLGP